LFDFDNQLGQKNSAKAVAVRALKQTAADRQRDVYDSHRHRTFALAFYMTGNEIEAEEILTNTFVQAFSASDEPNAQQVDSALVSELARRFPLREQEVSAIPVAGSANLSSRNVRRAELEEAIQTLPANERLLFLLRDVEGYTPAAISQLLGLSELQVQRSLICARLRLRQALSDIQNSCQEAA
jgi:RNA polymerase sigma factor (sigma-70 family)